MMQSHIKPTIVYYYTEPETIYLGCKSYYSMFILCVHYYYLNVHNFSDTLNLAILFSDEIKFNDFNKFVNWCNQLAIHFEHLVQGSRTWCNNNAMINVINQGKLHSLNFNVLACMLRWLLVENLLEIRMSLQIWIVWMCIILWKIWDVP